MARPIDISDLPEPLAEAIETIVRTYREQTTNGQRRSLGWAKGVLPELPPSFFDPLPDEIMELFEGRTS